MKIAKTYGLTFWAAGAGGEQDSGGGETHREDPRRLDLLPAPSADLPRSFTCLQLLFCSVIEIKVFFQQSDVRNTRCFPSDLYRSIVDQLPMAI